MTTTHLKLPCLLTLVAATWYATSTALVAAVGGRPIDIPERIRGAERVVVATAQHVQPEWRRNSNGDTIITSQILLQVGETLKGSPAMTLIMDLEGGTIGGVTLKVSSLPDLKVGERAVFFLDPNGATSHVPHLKGLGILKLDAQDRVQGSSLNLNEIRRLARENVR
jgi:hypothetical protein